MIFSIIVAVAENQVIGLNNELPWRVSSDLRRFRLLTMGKPLVMGRKTFQSLGKPLDGRDNIVVTRDENFEACGAFVTYSLEDALQLSQVKAIDRSVDEVMIIGGAEIYKAAMPFISRIYYTLIHASPEGDVFFPELENDVWTEVSNDRFEASEKDSFDYSLIIYEKNS